MSFRSVLTRVRRPVTGAVAAGLLLVGSLTATTPAQASTEVTGKGAEAVITVTATAPSEGPSGRALCYPPFRYSNAATWECTVFSGEYIVAWITCSGTTYHSPPIYEGSWFIVGVCPAGTWRDDEGILDY
jgi:hypothetical protein